MSHTLGPWKFDEDGTVLRGARKRKILEISDLQRDEDYILIEAAPDLLKACEGLLDMLDIWDSGFTVPGEEYYEVVVAKKAIAKATGHEWTPKEKIFNPYGRKDNA